MKPRKLLLLCVVAVLVLSTLGCALTDLLSKKDAEPTEEVVAEKQDTEAAPQPEEDEPAELVSTDELDSYRLRLKMSHKIDGESAGEWDILVEYVRDPRAMRMVTRGVDPEGNDASTEMIQIGDATYMNMGDGWMAMQGPEQDVSGTAKAFSDLGLDLTGCKYEGKEKVNGLETKHYRCGDEFFAPYWAAVRAQAPEGARLLEAQSDTWVSTKYKVTVRTIIEYKAKDPEDKVIESRTESDLTDINEDIKIEAPEGVEKPSLPEDIPLIDGATKVGSMMGMTNFEVKLAAEKVAEFYEKAMPKQGWTYKKDESMVPMMLIFTKGGRTARVMISPGDQSDITSVNIMVGEE